MARGPIDGPGGVLRVDLDAADDRFARLRLIEWWDQERLADSRVMVVGAGALGNELVKNLALLGVGNILIVDLDRIEASNLSRSVLFRERDEGRPKAPAAAEAARAIFPGCLALGLQADLIHDIGLGAFLWADLVLAGLDNREARLAINRRARAARTPWIDGAIERLDGLVRVFHPGDKPCYECTLGEADWAALAHRRSCNLLSREEMVGGRVPTTPTIASIIAAMQVQEAVKLLHGLPALDAEGLVLHGMDLEAYRVRYARDPDCLAHDEPARILALDGERGDWTVAALLERARQDLGPEAIIEFEQEMAAALVCPSCGGREEVHRPVSALAGRGACPSCGAERFPEAFHALRGNEACVSASFAELGMPMYDAVRARAGQASAAYLLCGDRPALLADLPRSPREPRP